MEIVPSTVTCFISLIKSATCQMADFFKEMKYVTLDSTLVYKH